MPPVRDLTGTAESSTVITLKWTAPDSLCNVDGYVIKYFGHVLWSDEIVEDSYLPASGDVTVFTVVDLIPWTNYTFEVLGQNGKENATDSVSTIVDTLQDSKSYNL